VRGPIWRGGRGTARPATPGRRGPGSGPWRAGKPESAKSCKDPMERRMVRGPTRRGGWGTARLATLGWHRPGAAPGAARRLESAKLRKDPMEPRMVRGPTPRSGRGTAGSATPERQPPGSGPRRAGGLRSVRARRDRLQRRTVFEGWWTARTAGIEAGLPPNSPASRRCVRFVRLTRPKPASAVERRAVRGDRGKEARSGLRPPGQPGAGSAWRAWDGAVERGGCRVEVCPRERDKVRRARRRCAGPGKTWAERHDGRAGPMPVRWLGCHALQRLRILRDTVPPHGRRIHGVRW
jgi:hypothetical protein